MKLADLEGKIQSSVSKLATNEVPLRHPGAQVTTSGWTSREGAC